MAVLHITEAELARDLHEVLEKVKKGFDVVIERDNRPIAVFQPPPPGMKAVREPSDPTS